MYDNLATTSIPSDIHLISSFSPTMISAQQQQQQFYNQMFGSLADVLVDYQQPAHKHQLRLQHEQRVSKQNYQRQRRCHNNYAATEEAQLQQQQHKLLRNTKSTTCYNHQDYQNHLLREQRTQSYIEQQQQYQNNQIHTSNTSPTVQPQQQQQLLWPQLQQSQQQHYLTIEELKTTRNSCWLCGCNWQEDHVSLDCPECDGYALTRPCPNCDGKCKQIWQRNISATHDKHRALWIGQCAFEVDVDEDEVEEKQRQKALNINKIKKEEKTSSVACNQLIAPSSSSLCSSHPSSAASSDSEADDFLSM